MTRSGPNDADTSFGLIVSFFFFFLRKFLHYLGATTVQKGSERVRGPAMTRTGPNDTGASFGLISKFFFLFFIKF